MIFIFQDMEVFYFSSSWPSRSGAGSHAVGPDSIPGPAPMVFFFYVRQGCRRIRKEEKESEGPRNPKGIGAKTQYLSCLKNIASK